MDANSPLFNKPQKPNEDKFMDKLVQDIARSKIDALGEFLVRLGVTMENHEKYTVVQSGNFPDIMYTVYKVEDTEKKNPLGSVTV